MLHSALQRLPRLPALSHRTFVSSVLLTKTWENEPVSALRNEAKTRSLSPYYLNFPQPWIFYSPIPLRSKGNKSTLISRILAHEKHIVSQGIPLLTLSRSASMASISPGIPPPSQPAGTLPEDFFHINLPDLSQRDSGPETQVVRYIYGFIVYVDWDNWHIHCSSFYPYVNRQLQFIPSILALCARLLGLKTRENRSGGRSASPETPHRCRC